MSENARILEAVDRLEIMQVSNRLLGCRNDARWEEMVQCFQPDAHVMTSWFDGTA